MISIAIILMELIIGVFTTYIAKVLREIEND